ncbi:hypothetical protein [Floridanema evergladense]|uniref:Uncharacterized protein n=1 Tax=Floridaenema evergladense BLCC-F167 TaxID=3153639 RepID=A0ABV4WVB7_9CYAN
MYNEDNKRTSSNREINRDSNESNYTEVPRSTDTIRDEYRDGYVHGRVAEHRYNESRQVDRDNNNAARGLILGLVMSSLLAIPAIAYYLWNRQNQEPVVTPAPVVVPSASPQPQPTIIQRERVIERNPEVRVVPVPQGQTPTTPAPNINIEQPASTPQPTPNVNITVPPASRQQSPNTTEQSSGNSSSGTSTQESPSVQSSPASGISGDSSSNTGDQTNTTTSGDNTSSSGTDNTSPAGQ